MLFAYVIAAFLAKPSWSDVREGTFLPQISFTKEYLFTFVAIFGTTISPYLFFWQAAQEVEADEALNHEIGDRPRRALERELRSARTDVSGGNGRLERRDVLHHPHCGRDAARARAHATCRPQPRRRRRSSPWPARPRRSSSRLGIVGTGLLGVPVLAGSAAYAVAEAAALATRDGRAAASGAQLLSRHRARRC